MNLPYSTATSGQRAVDDMRKILSNFGATKFGVMEDLENGTLTVQFVWRERQVTIEASAKGYAAAWLRENPYSTRKHSTRSEYEKKALDRGHVAVYSILRDWVKGQVTAVEVGMLSFEGAFLGQILLPSGRTILEHVQSHDLLPQIENKQE